MDNFSQVGMKVLNLDFQHGESCKLTGQGGRKENTFCFFFFSKFVLMRRWDLYVNIHHPVSTEESIMKDATELSNVESSKACFLEITLAWTLPVNVYG